MATRTLEDRLTIVEQELEQLKQQLRVGKPQETEPRWKQIVGVFKDDPLFDEAERLGREWRDAQQMEYDEDAESCSTTSKRP
jgi:hypothetical protein